LLSCGIPHLLILLDMLERLLRLAACPFLFLQLGQQRFIGPL
jgi:hypothetical protein